MFQLNNTNLAINRKFAINMTIIPTNILYIHGMGGGGDSRIPRLLKEQMDDVQVIVRTYSFDPEIAANQIAAWMEELHPALVIGESLGSIHALRLGGVPHLFVSPSLGAPKYLYTLSFLAYIPGVPRLCGWIWHPREGDRQQLIFRPEILRKYRNHEKTALAHIREHGQEDLYFAFFGTRDHYRRSGVVSVRLWEKYFGKENYILYEGTHFMEETYVSALLIPKIREILIAKIAENA